MFLEPAELRSLTGRAHRTKQAAWLRDQGWRFVLDADGRPRVDTRYYERRMLMAEQRGSTRVEPNFAALE